MKFTIKSEKLEHKDQIIKLYFSEIIIISDLNFDPYPNKPDINVYKYEGKSVWSKYLGPSRIDGFPIFEIDTTQLDREEKIDEVLEKIIF
jgi:hypothetical protein